MTQNLSAANRHEQILVEALNQAKTQGYQNVSAAGVARALGVQASLVFHYFANIHTLRRDVMRRAIRDQVLPIIAQGVALRDRQVMRAPLALRNKAVAQLQR